VDLFGSLCSRQLALSDQVSFSVEQSKEKEIMGMMVILAMQHRHISMIPTIPLLMVGVGRCLA
jgi:hypothetical protein